MEKPDLWDTLQFVRDNPGLQSYVLANKLREQGYKGCSTTIVRKQLNRLQKIGRVRPEYKLGVAHPYWNPT